MFKKKWMKQISNLDWAIFGLIAGFCFFMFQQGDINHTGASSIAYLNGHFLDFYDYNVQFAGVNNYLPTTYILFALWNIPIRLLGWITFPDFELQARKNLWYKMLPTLAFLASAMLFYKILREMKADDRQAKTGAFIYLSSPIAFYSQFMFGQYDSLTVFFMLWGIYELVKDRPYRFALIFGISITLKYFSLLVFIPLLLLHEKRYGRIIRLLALAALPFMLETLIYLPSEAFRRGVFGFSAVGYITNAQINVGFPMSIVIVLWLMLCGFAFFQREQDKATAYKWSVYLTSLVCFLIFGLCLWHPQWLMFMTPFLVFGLLYHERGDAFLIVDLLMMGAYVLLIITFWPNHVDQQLIELGAFGDLVVQKGAGMYSGTITGIGFPVTMANLLHAPQMIYTFSAFAGLLLVATLFKHPKYLLDRICEKAVNATALIRLRFIGGVSIFVIPAMICFAILLASPDPVLLGGNMAAPMDAMTEESDLRQYFTSVEGTVSEVRIAAGTFARVNKGELYLELYDAESEEPLAQAQKSLSEFKDNQFTAIPIPETTLEREKPYYIKLHIQRESGVDMFCLYRAAEGRADDACYATVDGERMNYKLCVNLYGEGNKT